MSTLIQARLNKDVDWNNGVQGLITIIKDLLRSVVCDNPTQSHLHQQHSHLGYIFISCILTTTPRSSLQMLSTLHSTTGY